MRKFLSIVASFLLVVVGVTQILALPHGESSADRDDDSDMWMEPDELPAPKFSVVKSESRVVRQYTPIPEQNGGFLPMLNRPNYATISRVENYEPQLVSRSEYQNPVPAEQNFFPSFFRNAPVSVSASQNQRPFKSKSNSAAASIAGRYSASGRATNFDQSILGSGDFAVMRGGTFYPDGERSYRFKNDDGFFGGFFKNGHGRPNAQAQRQQYFPEDPFENFKDFADINAGSDPAFSHFVVIYANKNATKPHPSHPSPKNIFEQLQLLDLEKEKERKSQEQEGEDAESDKDIYDKKLMKLSKFKKKLAKTKIVKKYKKKLGPKVDSSADYTDPLLATS